MGWGGYGGWGGFRQYVPVAQKLANAVRHAAQIARKQGREPSPVKLESKKIATTFWGKAWCDNLQAYSDYANRLPRGATYVRNGSVVDLIIQPRRIEALVAGSETYKIKIEIDGLAKPTWKKIKQECSASIDSLLDLLAGRFSDGVMQRLTRQKDGLFPSPCEIKMNCSCPDWSDCCKHLAAVMYGIGARLDKQPELLFLLREVDHQELVSQAVAEGNLDKELAGASDSSLAGEDLGTIFGIELDAAGESPLPEATVRVRKVKTKTAAKSKATTKPKSAPKLKSVAGRSNRKVIAARTKTANPIPAKSVAKSNTKRKSVATKQAATQSKKTVLALASHQSAPKRAIKKTA